MLEYHYKLGGIVMTRLDCYIKRLILERLQFSEFYMNEREELLLHRMIQEVYQNHSLIQLDVEKRVDILIQKYGSSFQPLQSSSY